jgi:tetratricopeptide (TPR) repeat protein
MAKERAQGRGSARRAIAAAALLALVLALAFTFRIRRGARHDEGPPGPAASAVVAVSAALGAPPTDLLRAWQTLDDLANAVRARHATVGDPWPDAIVHVLFRERGFVREIVRNEPAFYRLSDVLGSRRGNCLGLTALYLVLAERVGAPADAVRVPGHVFVRTRESPPRNLELLRQGEAMPSAWYQERYGPWPAEAGYFAPLSLAEVEALFWYDAGGAALAQGKTAEAAHDFARALARAPRFAEAAASLGLVRQLSGARAEAAAAYDQARQLRPDLPGLAHNLSVLGSP